MNEKEKFMNSVHKYGRWSSIISMVVFVLVGFAICGYYDVFPDVKAAVIGCVIISAILLVSGIIEFITFIPKLGSGATYINFITGNVSNMKVPSIEAVFNNLEVEDGSEDKEIVGIIVSCVASIFVMVLITIIVLFTGVLQPILSWEPIQPAFNYVMPAIYGLLLFGVIAQAGRYVIPTLIITLLLAVAGLDTTVLVFVSVGVGLAIFLVDQKIIKKKKHTVKEEEKNEDAV